MHSLRKYRCMNNEVDTEEEIRVLHQRYSFQIFFLRILSFQDCKQTHFALFILILKRFEHMEKCRKNMIHQTLFWLWSFSALGLSLTVVSRGYLRWCWGLLITVAPLAAEL